MPGALSIFSLLASALQLLPAPLPGTGGAGVELSPSSRPSQAEVRIFRSERGLERRTGSFAAGLWASMQAGDFDLVT